MIEKWQAMPKALGFWVLSRRAVDGVFYSARLVSVGSNGVLPKIKFRAVLKFRCAGHVRRHVQTMCAPLAVAFWLTALRQHPRVLESLLDCFRSHGNLRELVQSGDLEPLDTGIDNVSWKLRHAKLTMDTNHRCSKKD